MSVTQKKLTLKHLPVLLISLLLFPCNSKADDPKTYSQTEMNRLLERLEKAEMKISEVQNELFEFKNSQKDQAKEPELIQTISGIQDAPGIQESAPQLGPVNAPVSGNDYDSILNEMDQKWEEQNKINKELEKSLKKYVLPGTSLSKMKVSGRIHADYWSFPGDSPGVNVFESRNPNKSPNDRIGFRRARFGVKGDVWENMDYKIEMEFAGGDDSEFRDIYFSFKDVPVLQTFRIGNQKRPYGLDHLNSSRYNVFMERPFVIEAFNQDSRRLGLQSWGHSEDLEYNWRFGLFNQRLIQDEGFYISDHLQGEIAGRFAHTLWYDHSDGRNYGHWGISGTAAHPDGSSLIDNLNLGRDANEARFRQRPEARSTLRWLNTGRIAGADWYELLGLEGVVNVGPVQMVGEYQQVWLQRDNDRGPDVKFGGGYAYLSYFLTGEHIPWNRETGTIGRVTPKKNFFLFERCCGRIEEGWGAWQVAVRYSYADLTDDNVYGGIGESVTLGLNWHWNPNARMQFNYIYGEITDRQVTALDNNVYTEGDYHILGLRMMVDF